MDTGLDLLKRLKRLRGQIEAAQGSVDDLRQRRAAIAKQARAEGLTISAIALAMGVSRQSAYAAIESAKDD